MLKFFQRLFDKKSGAAPVPELTIPPGLEKNYEMVIDRVLPYYGKLKETNRKRFLNRVYNFRTSKSFHFNGLEPREEIMILISAAAIQVTFGLKNYRFPFFTDIYIHSDAYQEFNAKVPYIGHVAPSGIYISWKHFVQGFADYSDCFNVALHEMAHALHHENFIRETGIDWDFRQDFDKLPAIFGPLMAKAIMERKSYLRGYAFTNFHEFWAVSVEYFFENPGYLKDNLPQLYAILCRTLKQDPLHLDELVVVD